MYSIGLDIGTTSTKAVLFSNDNKQVDDYEVTYPLIKEKPDYAEQEPEVIVAACSKTIRELINQASINREDVRLVGISSAMHSLMVVDKNNNPLTPLITWADNRCAAFIKELKVSSLGERFYEKTGTPIHPMSWIGKIQWLRTERPQIFKQAFKFISIKEYLCKRLFGEYVVDQSLASGTGLYHLKDQKWDKEILEFIGIGVNQLSKIVPTTYELSSLTPKGQMDLSLTEKCRFIIGASDGVLANVGANAIEPGTIAVTIGTSGAVRTIANKPTTDQHMRTFCYVLTEDSWIAGGATNNGGLALQWYLAEFAKELKDIKGGQTATEQIIQEAMNVPAGSQGLLFLPFLNGERAPYWNPDARGSFLGVSMIHKRAHFARAVMEGVIYSVYSIVKGLQESIGDLEIIQASGGFARSDKWVQMLADITGKEIHLPETYHASALGAVLLAKHAIGENDLFSASKQTNNKVFTPNEGNHIRYQEMYNLYERIYQKLEDEFPVFVELQSK
ncbi:gluconokinase [Bacillus sp. JCM 19041]|uniref:gluconokinase n=1 Tax=Bacillus sp. JCM 19041 TaxID=1460637 RepID=UPI0006D0EF59